MEFSVSLRGHGFILFVAGILTGAAGLHLSNQLRARRLAAAWLERLAHE